MSKDQLWMDSMHTWKLPSLGGQWAVFTVASLSMNTVYQVTSLNSQALRVWQSHITILVSLHLVSMETLYPSHPPTLSHICVLYKQGYKLSSMGWWLPKIFCSLCHDTVVIVSEYFCVSRKHGWVLWLVSTLTLNSQRSAFTLVEVLCWWFYHHKQHACTSGNNEVICLFTYSATHYVVHTLYRNRG